MLRATIDDSIYAWHVVMSGNRFVFSNIVAVIIWDVVDRAH